MLSPDLLIHSNDWKQVSAVIRLINEFGGRAFVVGGWVRDTLLGRKTHDIDFAVDGNGLEIARHVAEKLQGKFVPLDDVNRIGRVVFSDQIGTAVNSIFDFASLVGSNIEADLGHRDFTINAVAAVPASSGESVTLIDPYHGITDLHRKKIKVTNPQVFAADPIRLLRAVRLAAQLEFKIEEETENKVREYASLIFQVAGERLRDELVALLSLPASGKYLGRLDELGLLTTLMPELEAGRVTDQPRDHQWPVLRHSIETVKAFDFLIRESHWEYTDIDILKDVPWNDEIAAYFNEEISYISNRKVVLRLAAVLHDIAKPQTRTAEPNGKIRFLGHANAGAEVVCLILERLRFTNREIKFIELAVKYHLRPTQMGWPELPTDRAIYRFYRDTAEASLGILFLSLSDYLSMRGSAFVVDDWRKHTEMTSYILSKKNEMPTQSRMLIDGYDIMSIFDLVPGRRVGELKEIIREAQAAGQIKTRQQAVDYLKEFIQKPAFEEG